MSPSFPEACKVSLARGHRRLPSLAASMSTGKAAVYLVPNGARSAQSTVRSVFAVSWGLPKLTDTNAVHIITKLACLPIWEISGQGYFEAPCHP